MAQLAAPNLDDDLKDKLQQRARRHGRSMEEEVRTILCDAVRGEGDGRLGLGTKIAARFAGLDSPEIEELRGQSSRPATFDS